MSGTNPVGTWATDPDFETQLGTDYKTAIDNAILVAKRFAQAFAPHEQSTPNMTVRVDAGYVFSGSTVSEIAAQSTGTITAPSANPRIDRVVVDAITGAVTVVTGSESGSPVAPGIPDGKNPVAQVLLQTSSTEITNTMITDERVPLAALGSVNPPARHAFLAFDFDPYAPNHLMSGATTPKRSALGNLIHHGGIINMTDQPTEQIADANFSETAVKFGKYLFAPGANIGFGVWTDRRWCAVTHGFVGMVLRTNAGVSKKIAHCTNLEFALDTDASGFLKFSVTDRTAAGASSKVVHSITGTTAFNSGSPTSRRVIIVWENLQSGAADGALSLYVEDATGAMQLEASLTATDIHPAGTFGFWVFGTGKNDPTWDRFTPMDVLPSANGWTATGTFATNAVSDGVLTITTDGLNSGIYEITAGLGSLTKANGWTAEIKLRERNQGPLEEDTDVRAFLSIRDAAHVVSAIIHGTRLILLDEQGGSVIRLRVSHNFQEDLSTVRLTLAAGADVVKVYINGRHAGTSDALSTGGLDSEIRFGDNSTTSGANVDWDVAYVAYRFAEVAPQVGGMVGGIDDVVIGRFVPTALERIAMAASRATDVFGNEGVIPGSWIPPMPLAHTSNPQHASLTMTDMPEMHGFFAADGVSDYIIGGNAAVRTDTVDRIVDTLMFAKSVGGFPEVWERDRRTVNSSGTTDNNNTMVVHGPKRIRPNAGLNELRLMWANDDGVVQMTNQSIHREINVSRA